MKEAIITTRRNISEISLEETSPLESKNSSPLRYGTVRLK